MLPIDSSAQHMTMSQTVDSPYACASQKGTRIATLVLGVAAALLTCGCNSTLSTRADPIRPVLGADANLEGYQHLAVVPFQMDTADRNSKALAEAFRKDLIIRLKYDFGHLFESVGDGDVQGDVNTLVLGGVANRFDEGNEDVRSWLGPLPVPGAAAILSVDVSVCDAVSGEVLMRYEVRKRWDFGGGIWERQWRDLVAQAAGGIAKSIALAKGWQE